MTIANATIDSRRFGMEIEVEGISTERVRLMGGTLKLQSKKDAGTTLTVEVPV